MTYTTEQLEGLIRDALANALGEAMDCTRVWSAWSHGTMTQDDFVNVADDSERLAELVQPMVKIIATAQIAALKRVAELEAENERLTDGIAAIRQYGWDTLAGPTVNADDTRDWQRAGVNEMTKRAVRLASGETWDAPTGDAT